VKKALFIFLAAVMVFGGVYGVYHLSRLHRAETEMNGAILNINEGELSEAIDTIKEVLSEYRYRVVRAPALYLLADSYGRTWMYGSSEKTYNIILSDPSLKEIDNWWIGSIVSLSKLYRKGHLKASFSQKETLVRSIDGVIDEMQDADRTGEQISLTRAMERFFLLVLTFNFEINVEVPSDETVLRGLKTELGYLLIETGDYGRAEEVLKNVDTPVSRLGLVKLYLKKGEYEKGIELLKGLLAYDKTGYIKKYYIKQLFDYAEELYSKRIYHDALELYAEIEREAPDTTYSELALYRLAKYYYNNRDDVKSFQAIEKMLSNSIPLKDEEALILKGYIYYDRREFVKALKVFKEFIKSYPKSEELGTAREWKAMTERSIKYIG